MERRVEAMKHSGHSINFALQRVSYVQGDDQYVCVASSPSITGLNENYKRH